MTYVLRELLAHGPHADILLGNAVGESRFAKPVAIKRCATRDATIRARVIQDAKAVAALRHRGIVEVLDLVSDEAALYVIMEYVDGPSLGQILRSEALSSSIASYVALEVAEAMAFAHERGRLHGDLRPANVLLTRGGGVRIASMKSAPGRHPAHAMPYAAPESLGMKITAGSDVYAVGVMLLEMLHGRVPPRGLARGTMPRISRLRDIGLQASARSRRERFPTMRDLATALREERFAGRLGGGAHELAHLIQIHFTGEPR